MYDDMSLDDAMDLVAKRRERQARQKQTLAWCKFAMLVFIFSAIMILMR